MPLVYIYLKLIGEVPPKAEYEKKEYEASLQAFANVMLRLRDGKTRNLNKNGVLNKLVRELKKAATVQGGYPDSDDDSDDDDDNDSDDESDSDDEKSISLANPNEKFGLHNVFKRSNSVSRERGGSMAGTSATTTKQTRRGSVIKRVSSLLKRQSLLNEDKNDSNKNDSSVTPPLSGQQDIEMNNAISRSRKNSSFLLKQEKQTKRVSTQMKKLAITIVNAPVEGLHKKKHRRRQAITASFDNKVFRNREKVSFLIAEAYAAMDKANNVKNIDGFLDVYKVAAKKCSNLANVRQNMRCAC